MVGAPSQSDHDLIDRLRGELQRRDERIRQLTEEFELLLAAGRDLQKQLDAERAKAHKQ